MIYRLALGQPNQEDFIEVLSRGGEATRSLLQPLVLDLSAMGLRQTKKIAHDLSVNGNGPLPAVGPSVLEAGSKLVPPPTPEGVGSVTKPFEPVHPSPASD